MVVLVMLVALPALTLSKCNSQTTTVGAVLFVCVGAVCLLSWPGARWMLPTVALGPEGRALTLAMEPRVVMWCGFGLRGLCLVRVGWVPAQHKTAWQNRSKALQSFFGIEIIQLTAFN
jgi:hypothetical protein